MSKKEWIGIIAAIVLAGALIFGLLIFYITNHYAGEVQVKITQIEYIQGHLSYSPATKIFVNIPSKTRIYFKYNDIEWDDYLEGDQTDKFTVGQITTGMAIYRKQDNSISRVYLDDD